MGILGKLFGKEGDNDSAQTSSGGIYVVGVQYGISKGTVLHVK